MRHREEVRAAFVSAINDWLHASDASGALMTAMAEARVAATTELWHTGGKAIMKASSIDFADVCFAPILPRGSKI